MDMRFEMWKNFYNWWIANADPLFGTGMGGFEFIGPTLKTPDIVAAQKLGFFVAHNDWLQIGFESGLVGLTLSIIGFVIVAWRLKGKDLATWLGLGAGMFFYYPSHCWPVQILAVILISRTRKEPACSR